jgi:catechol 2,3-dioxygenase-like lactoylglutathione lyase family enzyme
MLRLNHVTFACEDPRLVAEFWAQVLDGYSAEAAGESWRAVGEGIELFFNRVEKSPTIELPIHLDINVPDREEELQRLLGLGARLVETKSHSIGELSETWTVMRDPEGNGREGGMDEREFESFYATRNPDGSRPRLLFQRRERSRPESYPIHLDLLADDREAEVERLTAAGATAESTKSDEERVLTVMRDPDGNPFCVE